MDDVLRELERLRTIVAAQRRIIYQQWLIIGWLLQRLTELTNDLIRMRKLFDRALQKIRDWEYFVIGWGEKLFDKKEERYIISQSDIADNSPSTLDKLRRFYNRFMELSARHSHEAPTRFKR